tara:strand:- start:2148 stop:3215 length:1068 start_codon:yes stop_codon:yes gene_type:complete
MTLKKSQWARAILDESATLSDAIKTLNDAALRIVMVADSSGMLLGTVTDGDIRRAIIKEKALSISIREAMNSNPVTGRESDPLEVIRNLMSAHDVLQIPILDKQNRIVGVEVLQELVEADLENHVLIMAGGFGKRLGSLTASTPKPMLDVGGIPILERIIRDLSKSGFKKIHIAIHYKGEVIKSYFGDGKRWDVSIDYVEEQTPLGTGGALTCLSAESWAAPLLVLYGDLVLTTPFRQMLSFHCDNACDVTMAVREHLVEIPYGVVETQSQRVIGLSEKPTERFFINAGIYILDQSISRKLPEKTPFDMPTLVSRAIDADCEVMVFPLHEYWKDIGRLETLEEAKLDYQEKNRDR